MLIREEGDAVICIGQPAHAWLSGQLARAWALDPVEPRDHVVLAAEQHDLGMAAWDSAPELNPDTGLPQSFMEMDLDTHLQLWTSAPQRMLPQSRYAAVLVSMHGEALYEMRDVARMDDSDAEKVREYLAAQAEFQERHSQGFDTRELRRNQRLIWIWDSLSLGLCLRWEGEFVEEVTLAPGTIEPWPFRDAAVTLRTEGRRLQQTFDDEALMRAALDAAPWVELEFRLSRA